MSKRFNFETLIDQFISSSSKKTTTIKKIKEEFKNKINILNKNSNNISDFNFKNEFIKDLINEYSLECLEKEEILINETFESNINEFIYLKNSLFGTTHSLYSTILNQEDDDVVVDEKNQLTARFDCIKSAPDDGKNDLDKKINFNKKLDSNLLNSFKSLNLTTTSTNGKKKGKLKLKKN